jgi:hypothetical protein
MVGSTHTDMNLSVTGLEDAAPPLVYPPFDLTPSRFALAGAHVRGWMEPRVAFDPGGESKTSA